MTRIVAADIIKKAEKFNTITVEFSEAEFIAVTALFGLLNDRGCAKLQIPNNFDTFCEFSQFLEDSGLEHKLNDLTRNVDLSTLNDE